MSKLALWCEIAVIWGLILEKVRQKPDFWARTREIGAFLAAILPEKANLGEIAAQNAAIITSGQKKLRAGPYLGAGSGDIKPHLAVIFSFEPNLAEKAALCAAIRQLLGTRVNCRRRRDKTWHCPAFIIVFRRENTRL
ncbi:hypothetical protein [Paenibacillus faecis]|uniref:hypothetical protein n=1 Tax=Paenibacillus faecis TaxID=862114 RepID=UPI001BCC5512|nr:hypothetical protein [Paenibacillus faecis]